MAGMAGAFVAYLQRKGRKCGGQLVMNGVGDAHPRNFVPQVRKSSDTFSCFLPVQSHTCLMVEPRAPRFKTDIRIKPGGKAKKPEPQTRMCEAPDCVGPGNCRVAKSPKNLSEYFWYCPTHARIHNEAWDYFKGMDDDEIQAFRLDALTGHRPTWQLGKRAAKARMGQSPLGQVHDSHAVIDEDGDTSVRRPERHLTRLQTMAFDTHATGAQRHLDRDQGAV